MAEPILFAGLADEPSPVSPRKARLKEIREKLRKADATDDDYEDALEALVELSKD